MTLTPCNRLLSDINDYYIVAEAMFETLSKPELDPEDSEPPFYSLVQKVECLGRQNRIGHPGGNRLLGAVREGDHPVIHRILGASKDQKDLLSIGDSHGITHLLLAALKGDCAVAEMFLERGANPNLTTVELWQKIPKGATPLDVAAQRKDQKMCQLLRYWGGKRSSNEKSQLDVSLRVLNHPFASEVSKVTELPYDLSDLVLEYALPKEKEKEKEKEKKSVCQRWTKCVIS